MLHRHSTDPTERSMPPVMMTIVMPSAMIATKVKLRVTLNRLFGVANESVAKDRKMPARADRDEDPERLARRQPGDPVRLVLLRPVVDDGCHG